MSRLTRSAIFIASVAVLTARPVLGQGRDPASADALFRQARELMSDGDFQAACPKLVESLRLDPAPGTAVNLGDCMEKLGNLADALQSYRAAMDLLQPEDARIAPVSAQIAALQARVPKLRVKLGTDIPSGTQVMRDDVLLGPGSLGVALPANPGSHTVVVTAPGRRTRRYEVSLQEGQIHELAVEAGNADPIPVTVGPPKPALAPRPSPAPSLDVVEGGDGGVVRTAGYVTAAVGVVGLGFGTFFALTAKSTDNEARGRGCDDSTCPPGDQVGLDLTEESRQQAKLAVVGFVAGGTALAGGVAMILLAPRRDGRATVALSPVVNGRMGVQVGATW